MRRLSKLCAMVLLALYAVFRGRWLLGLLVLQSTSSFVLDSYQDLLKVINQVA